MATRLSVITTRSGDQGTTGLGDGSRIDKDAPRIAALGDVDELNSAVGLLRAETLPQEVDALLARIQNDLFDLGAELCIPGHKAVSDQQVLFLETSLAQYNAALGDLKEFILPGGTRPAALAHMARTVCRRAERSVVALGRADDAAQSGAVLRYLNRLSDLCFVLARSLNRSAGRSDVLWRRQD
ncbi:MAG TPA: cob(I)yrinic acid a,c-diamide adenosyltransferase [Pusillimonas sp.]|uniref:cob(I)yrinic acid a,c-diamide adenosyltransferase n=1 Tax=Pusillimonas sp. TaxID=3040095 RepID=UPI002C5A80A8|nr:cob(I)yrinic acid a,c-diamide adenosyltransferase [Pusillimonas sp.]HUH87840.1 cob(I)yrinic acid a,c-diamide adenosyltransferase [Pusillimonas sp.]